MKSQTVLFSVKNFEISDTVLFSADFLSGFNQVGYIKSGFSQMSFKKVEFLYSSGTITRFGVHFSCKMHLRNPFLRKQVAAARPILLTASEINLLNRKI